MTTTVVRSGVLILGLLLAAPATPQDAPPSLPFLPATTVQLPTFGISIDAAGTLDARTFKEFDGKLLRERLAAAKAARPGEVWTPSKLRKVSLVRLEAALQADLAAGRKLDDAMRNTAGLTRLQYVFCYPAKEGASGDIVFAGPSEPFALDAAGRSIGLKSGRPVLQLDDLAAALRVYPPDKRDRPFLGCTIDPPAEGLARLVAFQKTVPRAVRQQQRAAIATAIAQGVADSLGMAQVRVFGVSGRTHFAHVLVEADYRMKRIAIGAEPPPVKMVTFLEALESPQQGMLQRWWFTPDYKSVKLAGDELAVELIGQGVQLLAEDKLIGPDGSLAAAGVRPNKASELFTLSFTRKYPEIAAASPVYAQLRTLIDLTIAAAILRRYDYYSKAGWAAAVLGNEEALSVETLVEPRQVQCVVNSLWKGNRLLTTAGGGISIRPDEALAPENLLPDSDGSLRATHQQLSRPADETKWWWD